MLNNQSDKVEQLKRLLPDIPAAHGKLKKEGPTSMCGPCPFCGGGVDRFVYKTDSKRWWCRNCRPEEKPSDKIEFHSLLQGTDFSGLVKKYLTSSITESGKESFKHFELGIPVEKYPYTDSSGNVLYYNCRFNPKAFRPCSADGKSWSLKIKQKVPFQLPEVIKAKTVFILNGEKACLAMKRINEVGTCNVSGEGNWTSDLNEYFRDKEIIIIPDNDSKGRQHAEKVYEQLRDVTADIKLLELPDIPEKGDFYDWLSTFGDDHETASERWAILVECARQYEPKQEKTISDVIIPISQFCKISLPDHPTLLKPFLKSQTNGMVVGPRGIAKTWFCMGISKAVATGENFGPWESKNPAPVLYLDAEMTSQDVIERARALGLDEIGSDRFFIYCDAYANQLGLPRANLINEKWRDAHKALLLDKGIKLQVLDNIASLAPGIDENAKQDWDEVNQWLLELRFAGISTILVHHAGKSGNQRGTSAREDNLDYSIALKRPTDYFPEDGARFIATFTKARVSNKYLSLIGDTEFKLQEIDGKYEWTFGNVKKTQKKAVLKLLDEGLEPKIICETLGLTKGYVSKIKNQAVKDGLLSIKGKLTQSGFMAVNND